MVLALRPSHPLHIVTTTPYMNQTDHRSDYFSFVPLNYCVYHPGSPLPSPIASPVDIPQSPHHFLLADRGESPYQAYDSTAVRVSNFMAMQTSAAHAHSNRPRPYPVQNVLHVTSDDSSSSNDGSCSSKSSLDFQISSPEIARCSRCQRTPSVDIKTGKSNMIQYGLNLWYCSRCAGMVGLIKR